MIALDTSVVTKWFKPDEKSPRADFYLEEHLAGRNPIFVPTLLLYELTNALWHSKKLARLEIERAVAALQEAKLSYVDPDELLLASALEIAEKTKLSIYDASYVALARRLGCTFVTADRKLFRSAKFLADITLL